MAGSLPPPPVNDQMGSFSWLEWYRQLRNYVSTSGSVPWYIINFSGSNITDIASRSHQNLQSLQGGGTGQMYHLTSTQYSSANNHIQLLNTTASVACPTTPTVLLLPTNVTSNGITYDSGTGEFVFTNGGSFSLSLMINATTSTINKLLYVYASIDTGSGYAISRWTARSQEVVNTITQQYIFTSSNYFAAGTKLKLYVYGSATGITYTTADLPGTTAGTATIPAIRLMWAGGL